MNSAKIRKMFLDYFEKKGHRIFAGISLVPLDPTMLFTTAGMVQFKNNFLGKSRESYVRAASSQRCFRTSDIENVGITARHLTFFEMLGNFSFGDYFKKETIGWGWDFLTKELQLPQEKLFVSVYEADEEAFKLWKDIIPENRIFKLGKNTNFWEMGETGPCGPCSEIYFDMGKENSCDNKDCIPGCDCDRWIEIWNLVFTQYNRDINGKLAPLPQKNIDTGMGLERLAMVVNGLKSSFDTDLLKPIIDFVSKTSGTAYKISPENDVHMKILADHSRGIAFLIADGVTPSNEGRGYILRRIIRRAARQANMLDIPVPFIYKLAETVIKIMKEPYPELETFKSHIIDVTKSEEENFKQTLDAGIQRLNELMSGKKDKFISGKEAFRLYDTYGFPIELTKEIASEQGFNIDEKGFQEELINHRNLAKSSWKTSAANDIQFYSDVLRETGNSLFMGYDSIKTDSRVLLILRKSPQLTAGLPAGLSQQAGQGNEKWDKVDSAEQGDDVALILDTTPFYGESGGQEGDTGIIFNANSPEIEMVVTATKKPIEELIVHYGKISKGVIRKNDKVTALIDCQKRNAIRRNHTATHLLHAVLRKVLGTHVHQAGSLVSSERIRFDFTHSKPISNEELRRIEEIVNNAVLDNILSYTLETTLTKAKDMGAMALFGEKYGEKVRAVIIGNAEEKGSFSIELCGGTHCGSTAEIGFFKITAEGSIAAGLRRIEALTGSPAYNYVQNREIIINETALLLKTEVENIPEKVEKLILANKDIIRNLEKLKNKSVQAGADEHLKDIKVINGINTIIKYLGATDLKSTRELSDRLKEKLLSGIIVLGLVADNKPVLMVSVTSDLLEKGFSAVKIVKELALLIGGSGGGRPDMAQAGGKNPDKIEEALSKVPEILSHAGV